jgi:hypothetical protein
MTADCERVRKRERAVVEEEQGNSVERYFYIG